MKTEWDPNDFQGKSKRNYETSYRILIGCVVIITLMITWGFVYKLIRMIF